MTGEILSEAVKSCFRSGLLGRRTAQRLLMQESADPATAATLLTAARGHAPVDILLPSLRAPEDFPAGAAIAVVGQIRKAAYTVVNTASDSIIVHNGFRPYDNSQLPLNSLLYWGSEEFWDLRTRIGAGRSPKHEYAARIILDLELAVGLTQHSQEEVAAFTNVMCADHTAMPKQ